MTPPPPTYTLVVRARPDPFGRGDGRFARDADYHLKLLFKYMLRALGFRRLSVTQHPPTIAHAPPTE